MKTRTKKKNTNHQSQLVFAYTLILQLLLILHTKIVENIKEKISHLRSWSFTYFFSSGGNCCEFDFMLKNSMSMCWSFCCFSHRVFFLSPWLFSIPCFVLCANIKRRNMAHTSGPSQQNAVKQTKNDKQNNAHVRTKKKDWLKKNSYSIKSRWILFWICHLFKVRDLAKLIFEICCFDYWFVVVVFVCRFLSFEKRYLWTKALNYV